MTDRASNSNAGNPLTSGPHRAPARAMLKAVGFSDEDLKKPLIGVANTWIEIGPCNFHLRELAAQLRLGDIPPRTGHLDLLRGECDELHGAGKVTAAQCLSDPAHALDT